MSTAAAHADHGHDGHHGHDPNDLTNAHVHPPSFYVKTWVILLVLLVISFVGPFVGESLPATIGKLVTLLTAFGIAIVKAYMVCARFMHLNVERKYAAMLLGTTLVLISLFYFAVAPDVMKHEGQNWKNVAAEAATKRTTPASTKPHAAHGDHAPAAGSAAH
jgi:caa(3)-type oxidase subunit IV